MFVEWSEGLYFAQCKEETLCACVGWRLNLTFRNFSHTVHLDPVRQVSFSLLM